MRQVDNCSKKVALLACAAIALSFAFSVVQARNEGHTFRVHNKTEDTIKKILASEDGKTWGHFDIGDGIEPGHTVKIAWDKSTDDQSCVQSFKIVFDDGSETPPAKFDFCDADLVLEVTK
jgi:hypothetical protein